MKDHRSTLYEENNVICLVNGVFLHKGLEIPPPFKSSAKFHHLFNQMQKKQDKYQGGQNL